MTKNDSGIKGKNEAERASWKRIVRRRASPPTDCRRRNVRGIQRPDASCRDALSIRDPELMPQKSFENEVPMAPEPEDRDSRIVGFKMTKEAAFAWANKISKSTEPPMFEEDLDWKTPDHEHHSCVLTILQRQFEKEYKKHDIKHDEVEIREVGEFEDADFMVITREIDFDGYENMPMEQVPQEEKDEHDQNVEKWLRAEGQENWEFVTIVG
ncbi:hypothetical protein GALMADRAFT_213309 [Galerina marginata CBS 339.88]|uniref:Uncharacterized protein n=1 Tax=Galerina marginata (strain CBS 339.88) TaxID=685588 RepID=A0A067SMX5_GALM3|nr:hypothetical protein GALMADRAFT_213309 [Galerina marginata CBS 339.88]